MLCMWFCMIVLFVGRGSVSVAVLAMTDGTRSNETNVKIYNWDKKSQGMILSSFFWGYTFMQIPAGMLAKKFGGKPIVLVALVANGILSLLVPAVSDLGGWQLVCAVRLVMGVTQACLFPATHTMLGRWLPVQERTTYTGFVYGGVQLGTVISMPLSGLLAETAWGWQLIYYAVAAMMFVNAAVWYAFAASTPGGHTLISEREKIYIENGLKTFENKGSFKTPWRPIIRTRALWALMVVHTAGACCFILFFTDMPTYLEKGLRISMKNSALLSALPFIGMWLGSMASSSCCELVYNKRILSIITCRKICNSIGMFGLAIGLIVLSYLGPEDNIMVVIVLTVSFLVGGSTASGYMANHLDLSPTYAGVLLGITNAVASFGCILTPIITSFILQNDPHDVSRWRTAFLTTAAVCIGSNVIFLAFGSSDRQIWDDPNFETKEINQEETKPVLKKTKA